MAAPVSRRRWPRRVMYVAGGVCAAGLLLFVALWLALPALVRRGFEKGTAAAGFEQATLAVERADFSGLRARAVHLQLGGLDVSLDDLAADYGVFDLIGGRLDRIAIDGLDVTLDFTRPRRGLLPDAIADLLALIPESDDPLVWPVGELTVQNCRLKLVLPGGEHVINLTGTARRQADGRVAFELRADHPEQEIAVAGIVRTETMDGEFNLERVSLQPQFLHDLVADLGLWRMPEAIAFESARVNLGGSVALQAGELDATNVRFQTERVQLATAEMEATIQDLSIELTGTVVANPTINLRTTLAGQSRTGEWAISPVALEAGLQAGELKLTSEPATATFGEQASATIKLAVAAGVPALGGESRASLDLEVSGAGMGATRLAPFTLHAAGWTDHATITSSELRLAENSPAVLGELAIDLARPLEPDRVIDLSALVTAQPELAPWLPAGFALAEPALPAAALRLRGRVTTPETGPVADITIANALSRLRLVAGEASFSCVPSGEFTINLVGDALNLAGKLGAQEVENSFPQFPPGIRALEFGFEAPQIPLGALAEFAAGRVPQDELAARISCTVMQSETRGDAYVAVRHFGETAEWSAEVWGMLDNVTGSWGGAEVSGVRAEVTVNSGRLPDAQVGEWFQAPELLPLVRSLLPRLKVDVSLTANSVEKPGTGRLDWAGLWLQKPPAEPDAAPLQAGLTFYSGALEAGPERLEQPRIEARLNGTFDRFNAELTATGLLEGATFAFNGAQHVQVDWDTGALEGEGDFKLEPFTLRNSDIASRWSPDAKGISITATAAADGTLWWKSDGTWDGTAALVLSDAGLTHPDQGIRLEGVDTKIALTSLRELRTPVRQSFGFARLAIGDVEVTNATAHFSLSGANRIVIDTLQARVFGGDVSVGTFALVFPDPDVGTALEFDGVDAGELMRHVGIFQGRVTGKLRGKLPVGLIAGKPFFGEGYLELDPRYPASFSMDARGLFTTDLPDKTTKDRLVRLPYEVLEEALGDVRIRTMRIDLFNPDTPGTPIRIEFSGESDTPRARVPVNIVTNVNGSIPEALNFLYRLATL